MGPYAYNLASDGKTPVPVALFQWEAMERHYAGWTFLDAEGEEVSDNDKHGHSLKHRPKGAVALLSTVFLGIDHNHDSDGPPILWESLIFASGIPGDQEGQWRYTSYDEAAAGHQALLAQMQAIITLGNWLPPGRHQITIYNGGNEEEVTVFAVPQRRNWLVHWYWQQRLRFARWTARKRNT